MRRIGGSNRLCQFSKATRRRWGLKPNDHIPRKDYDQRHSEVS
ncbi:hypothetical protein ACU8KH_01681 [Lachancea thermotolerans]